MSKRKTITEYIKQEIQEINTGGVSSYNDLTDKPTIPDVSGKVDKVTGSSLVPDSVIPNIHIPASCEHCLDEIKHITALERTAWNDGGGSIDGGSPSSVYGNLPNIDGGTIG